jgi:hypothetical protein
VAPVVAYCRVEQSARDSEEDPGIDGEREAEGEAYVEKLLRDRALRKVCALATGAGLRSVGNLGPCKGQETVVWSQYSS